MSLTSAQVTVGTSATALGTVTPGTDAVQEVTITNNGTNPVFLGPAGVTITTGHQLAAAASLGPLTVSQSDQFFAVVAVSGTVTILQTQA